MTSKVPNLSPSRRAFHVVVHFFSKKYASLPDGPRSWLDTHVFSVRALRQRNALSLAFSMLVALLLKKAEW
jgi:hypothetical protein